jgi:adenosylcobinamide-GDP ribazoletransferase
LAETQTLRTGSFGLFLQVLRFYSRLPVPALAFEPEPHALPDFARAAWAIPLAGAIIGACGAAAGGFAYLLGLSTAVGAALTVAVLVAVTGAFHEDGLADCFDGFWGGATPERRREIMRDSRLGTFGVAGLALALALRVLALTELFRLIGPLSILAVIGIAAASRPLALLPVLFGPPAPGPGLGAATPMPGPGPLILAILIGGGILVAAIAPLGLLPGLGAAMVAVLLALGLVTRLAETKIGGHSGDVLGAAQQVTEIVLLLGLSAAANWQGPV